MDTTSLVFVYGYLILFVFTLGALLYYKNEKYFRSINIGRIDKNSWTNEDYLYWYEKQIQEAKFKNWDKLITACRRKSRVYWFDKVCGQGENLYE